MVLLDTCGIIHICRQQSTLSLSTRTRIKQGAFILSVSFAEMYLKSKKGTLELPASVIDIHQDFTEISHIQIINLGVQEWFDSIELEWKHRDPIDRLLVAYAQRHKLSIVTSDKAIKKFYKNVLW